MPALNGGHTTAGMVTQPDAVLPRYRHTPPEALCRETADDGSNV